MYIFSFKELHYVLHAAYNGHCSVVEYFIISGASIDVVDILSQSFLHVQLKNRYSTNQR